MPADSPTDNSADSPSKGYLARTLPQVVAESAAAYGDRVAISDGDVELTYAELDVARVRSAQAFLAAGIEKGFAITPRVVQQQQPLVAL